MKLISAIFFPYIPYIVNKVTLKQLETLFHYTLVHSFRNYAKNIVEALDLNRVSQDVELYYMKCGIGI